MIKIADETLYSLAEVGEVLGVCRGSVCNYIRRDTLKVVQVGGRRYVKEADLKAFATGESRPAADTSNDTSGTGLPTFSQLKRR